MVQSISSGIYISAYKIIAVNFVNRIKVSIQFT